MKRIAIFASGSGTNADAVMNYVEQNPGADVEISLVLSNNSAAFVLQRALNHGVPTYVFDKTTLRENPTEILDKLRQNNIDFVVLAGFMLLIPSCIIEAYRGRIINIHPALLPAYGGKGMYGDRVHKAVIENKERESGITIHFVDEHYDQGAVIVQAKCTITEQDTPQTLATKVQSLEHEYFPRTIIKTILEQSQKH